VENPYLGNIEYALSEGAVLPASLSYSAAGFSGLRSIMTFEDGFFEVSPTKWEPVDSDYDYESVENEILTKINSWRPYWVIKMSYSDKDNWLKICRQIQSLMNRAGHTFSATGVVPRVHFWFYPPGDAYRPRIEVLNGKKGTDIDGYFGGRYIGFGEFEIVIRGRKTYTEQHIPSRYIGTFDIAAGIIAPCGSIYIGAGVVS